MQGNTACILAHLQKVCQRVDGGQRSHCRTGGGGRWCRLDGKVSRARLTLEPPQVPQPRAAAIAGHAHFSSETHQGTWHAWNGGKRVAFRHSLGARVLFSCTSFFAGTAAFLVAVLGRARQRTGCAAARRATAEACRLLLTVRAGMLLRCTWINVEMPPGLDGRLGEPLLWCTWR